MELSYSVLALVALILVCLPALIYAGIINRRRRQDVDTLETTVSILRDDVALLERLVKAAIDASATTEPSVAAIPSAAAQPALSSTTPQPAAALQVAAAAPA